MNIHTLNQSQQSMVALVKEFHKNQTRHGGKSPYWHHCFYVGNTLHEILSLYKEGSKQERKNITLAGFGHDLYEDTVITRESIVELFGKSVHEYILGMTNEDGDDDRAAYVAKMSCSSEEIRPIKMADLLENYTSGVFCVYSEGVGWINDFLIPILDEMWGTIKTTEFVKYLKTFQHFVPLIDAARLKLHSTLCLPVIEQWKE